MIVAQGCGFLEPDKKIADEEHYAVLDAIDLHTLRRLILGPHIDITLREAGELCNEGDVQVQQAG